VTAASSRWTICAGCLRSRRTDVPAARLLALALGGAVAFAAAAPAAALAPDELFRQVSPSVWQVATSDALGKPLATGGAVVIAPQTLVTNCHVLKEAARVAVRQRNTSHGARLQHADTERDLCLLTVEGLQAPPV